MKSVAEKMGIRENSSAYFLNAPTDALQSIHLPVIDVKEELKGEFDYIHLFTKNQQDFMKNFPRLKKHLKLNGMLWVSWPKAKQLDTDLSLPKIIEIGYDFGLVESTALSINATWSAIKFTHPKKGKEYKNSYGKLKSITVKR